MLFKLMSNIEIPDRVIPMCCYASQATQKYVSINDSAKEVLLYGSFTLDNGALIFVGLNIFLSRLSKL